MSPVANGGASGAWTIQRIRTADAVSAGQLARLRTQLSTQGDVVSPRSQALTIKVFGEPLSPQKVVERICNEVRTRGVEALFHYTEQFDRTQLTPQTLRISRAELTEAHSQADPALLETIRRVRLNILAFQSGVLHRS